MAELLKQGYMQVSNEKENPEELLSQPMRLALHSDRLGLYSGFDIFDEGNRVSEPFIADTKLLISIIGTLMSIRAAYQVNYSMLSRDVVKEMLEATLVRYDRLVRTPEAFPGVAQLAWFQKGVMELISDISTIIRSRDNVCDNYEAIEKSAIAISRPHYKVGVAPWAQFLGKNAPGVPADKLTYVDPAQPLVKDEPNKYYQLLPHSAMEIWANHTREYIAICQDIDKVHQEHNLEDYNEASRRLLNLNRRLLGSDIHARTSRAVHNPDWGYQKDMISLPWRLETVDIHLDRQQEFRFTLRHPGRPRISPGIIAVNATKIAKKGK